MYPVTDSDVPRIAISAGDPAGIGPDIVLSLADRDWPAQLLVIADPELMKRRASLLGRTVTIRESAEPAASRRGEITLIREPLAAPVTAGTPDPKNADAVLRALIRMVRGCESGEFDAMVTAPVSKSVISDAGTPFSGHTEFLSELTGSAEVVMLLASDQLRVALATTHIPLAEVAGAITRAGLLGKLRVLHSELREKFGIQQPRISVLGLNPHAGESGKLGSEEIETIIPVMEELRGEGMLLRGPLPADTAFAPIQIAQTDAYLAMFHDQGLPVLKFAGFGGAVNITLGLPIIRTSVDHGTAFDLAGSGAADSGSLMAAVNQALELVRRRKP